MALRNIWSAGKDIQRTLPRGSRHLASSMSRYPASSMSDYPSHFYVTLFSNASQDLYPDNTIGAFTVELARPIRLGQNGNWEVGLCEFSCPPGQVRAIGESIGLIYCELIYPQFVGSSLVRCLRTYVYPSLDCQHKFEKVYYLPVEKQKITNIRIKILTLKGKRCHVRDWRDALESSPIFSMDSDLVMPYK